MLDGMYGFLTTATLLAAGWNCHRIKTAEQCCLRRLERGRYVVVAACTKPEHTFVSTIAEAATITLPTETTGQRKRAEDLRIFVRSYVDRLPPDAVFSHRSALVVHGLPIPYVDETEVFAESVSPRSGVRLANMLVRRRVLDPDAHEIIDGIPVTSVLQTMLDIARDCPLAFSVAVLDSAVRESVVTLSEIRTYCDDHPVRTGTRRILTALDNVDGRRESVAESICAVRFVEHSIDGFEPQVDILDEDGNHLGRTDFADVRSKVIAEFDGAAKYHLDGADPQRSFERERRREYALRNEGWMVFRIRWSELFAADVFLRIKEAVRRRRVVDESHQRGA